MSLRPPWLTLRGVAGLTTGMTVVLVMLGVYTAATGSGLACQAQWPLCSDQLIPALELNPDFLEWFHRAWAMVTGFLILGTAAVSWLTGAHRAVRTTSTLAVVLLPIQITVGAITVTIGGLVPGGYTVSAHAAHLLAALTIFTLLGLTTLFAGPERGTAAAKRAFAAAIGLLAVAALASRAVPLVTYSPGAQAWFYGFALLAHLALLSATLWAFADARDALAGIGAVALAGLFAAMLLGRDLVLYTATWQTVHQAVLATALGAAVVGLLVATRGGTRDAPAVASRGD